jgi:hypothetical protein
MLMSITVALYVPLRCVLSTHEPAHLQCAGCGNALKAVTFRHGHLQYTRTCLARQYHWYSVFIQHQSHLKATTTLRFFRKLVADLFGK